MNANSPLTGKLPDDIHPEQFGREIIRLLGQYGFGVLSKSDLEAVLLHCLQYSSSSLGAGDSYAQAEMLRITDQKYRSLMRRAGMWIRDDHRATDEHLFHDLLKTGFIVERIRIRLVSVSIVEKYITIKICCLG